MNDDWRLRIGFEQEGQAEELERRLHNFDREHDLRTAFSDRVMVSRDDAEVFCYAATRAQSEAAERAIRSLADDEGWTIQTELKHWHPTAEEWEDPDKPLPHSDAEQAAEQAERIEGERAESEGQGYPEYEVRVRCPSHHAARRLAEQLVGEGIPNVHRWNFVVVGAEDEDSAQALAERLRREAPEGSTVTAEGSAAEVTTEAPYATPFTPFAVFGGLGG